MLSLKERTLYDNIINYKIIFPPSLPPSLLLSFVWDRVSVLNPGWSWSFYPPASASRVLQLQMCATMPSIFFEARTVKDVLKLE
jgi:hypothetical protein